MKKAFTLIELLIVVAIIAILAAIAVPNFLEAQTRAKVSRAVSDMRTLATAIESYYVDNNKYPPFKIPGFLQGVACTTPGVTGTAVTNSQFSGRSIVGTGFCGVSSRLVWVTTPISYVTSIAPEAFQVKSAALAAAGADDPVFYDTYDYIDAFSFTPSGSIGLLTNEDTGQGISSGAAWRIVSAGPDLLQAFGGTPLTGSRSRVQANNLGQDYDPTNGTVSAGDIVRVGGGRGVGSVLPFIDRVGNRIGS